MPTIKKIVSTDQPARYLALTAIAIAVCSAALAFVGSSVLARRAHNDEYKNCVELQDLKVQTRRALLGAVARAQAALPDEAAHRSIIELRAEIALLKPRAC